MAFMCCMFWLFNASGLCGVHDGDGERSITRSVLSRCGSSGYVQKSKECVAFFFAFVFIE